MIDYLIHLLTQPYCEWTLLDGLSVVALIVVTWLVWLAINTIRER